MMLLDQQTLSALEQEWEGHSDGLTLPEFVWLMQCTLPHPSDHKLYLYDGLIALFNDIDINGDGQLEWIEFTQYITDAVITQKKINLIEDEDMSSSQLLCRPAF